MVSDLSDQLTLFKNNRGETYIFYKRNIWKIKYALMFFLVRIKINNIFQEKDVGTIFYLYSGDI